jgi:hypothetical protein
MQSYYKFIRRIYGEEGLKKKVSVVFKYLVAVEGIKEPEIDHFKGILEKMEQFYLKENHWTQAEYWSQRILKEHTDVFLEEIQKSTGP